MVYEYEASSIPLDMPTIRIKERIDIEAISEHLNKPLINIRNAQAKDRWGMEVTRKHSALIVISDGVMYKHVYDVKEYGDCDD